MHKKEAFCKTAALSRFSGTDGFHFLRSASTRGDNGVNDLQQVRQFFH